MMVTLTYVSLWLALGCGIITLLREARWADKAALGATMLSWGLLIVSLAKRAFWAGHWPLTNRYEFALCLVWTMLLIYLLLRASWHSDAAVFSGAFVLGLILLVATYAITRPLELRALAPLLPVLHSPWLQIHAVSALVGYGALGVSAGLALSSLAQPMLRRESGSPGHDTERAMMRGVALGFPWLTLSILTGAIWAQNAWGRYWGWDTKESWALITWLWYLLLLHVSPLRRWRGKRLAAFVLVGFGLVLFTFAGVSWLVRLVRLETLHGY